MNDMSHDEEVTLHDFWNVIWKRKLSIILLVVISGLSAAVYSFSIENTYQATAVIMPVSGKEAEQGSLSALIGGAAGFALPGSISTSEILNLLKSDILMKEIIERHDLMPILLYKQWDKEKKVWKKDKQSYLSLIMQRVKPENRKISNDKGNDTPTVMDGIRALRNITKVNNNIRENAITISIEFYDPEISAKMVNYFLGTLNEHMSNEAKRVAEINKKYFEEELLKTADPLLKQKIYGLIAQQIEKSVIADVKENFAFKVVDPPMVPDKKIRPQRRRMLILSLTVAFFVGIFLSLFFEYIKNVKGDT